MWTFPGLLFLFFTSAFPSAWIVRFLAPWLWSNTRPTTHILVNVTTIPEIENAAYVAYIIVFVVLFIFILVVTTWLHGRFRWFSKVIRAINYTCTLYLLVVPNKSLFVLDQIHPLIFFLSAIAGIVLGLGITPPHYVLSSLVGIVAVRHGLKPLVEYDVGIKQFPTVYEYLYYGLWRLEYFLAYIALFIVLRYSAFMRTIASRLSKRAVMIIIFLGISVTLLYLMGESRNPVDIYFTLLPAYQVVQGGTPLVSMMSQYGLLYLAPWVLWLVVFPNFPISFPVGTIVMVPLLILYFLLLLFVVDRLIRHSLLFVLTVMASYYFTILIRYYGFADMVSLVSAPAFTPLRFGIFIFPLWFLLSYSKRGGKKDFLKFLVASVLCFFYSFEIGIGIVGAGIATACVYLATVGKNTLRQGITLGSIGAAVFIGGIVMISAGIYTRSGKLPDWSQYVYFSKMFGSGHLMLPLKGQVGVFLPIGVAFFGAIFGLWRIVSQKNRDGFIFLYLALINIIELPYFIGRSVFPTLYNISLPFILLCGVLTEYGVSFLRKNKNHLGVVVMTGMCGYLLVIGGSKAMLITGDNLLHTGEIVESAARYIQKAVSEWHIQETPEYAFLKKSLPPGCPLLSFDKNEWELLTAMRVPPAYNFAFIRGFLTSREEVDTLTPYPGASRICVFINDRFIDTHDPLIDGIYTYFIARNSSKLRLIQEDKSQRFRLYELPLQ